MPTAPTTEVVTLTVNGQTITGWTEVTIRRGMEHAPSQFDVALTSINPVDASKVNAAAGDAVTVSSNGDLLLTGYIDTAGNGGDASGHSLKISGRGKCQDLVDCSAEWPGMQIKGANVLEVATKLASPYGIAVRALPGADLGPTIPQFGVNYGEAGFEIIDRVARYAGVLAYEDVDGALLLGQVGTTKTASGFKVGQDGNVQAWLTNLSASQRYSDYATSHVSTELFNGTAGPSSIFATQKDPYVGRHRLLYFVTEFDDAFGKRRALWEATRRAGRGLVVSVTADSWRDSAGKLWSPNTLAPVDVPGLDPRTLCISEVAFSQSSKGGTTASAILMPSEAFALQPTLLVPLNLNGTQVVTS